MRLVQFSLTRPLLITKIKVNTNGVYGIHLCEICQDKMRLQIPFYIPIESLETIKNVIIRHNVQIVYTLRNITTVPITVTITVKGRYLPI
jgi:hypothetical protein